MRILNHINNIPVLKSKTNISWWCLRKYLLDSFADKQSSPPRLWSGERHSTLGYAPCATKKTLLFCSLSPKDPIFTNFHSMTPPFFTNSLSPKHPDASLSLKDLHFSLEVGYRGLFLGHSFRSSWTPDKLVTWYLLNPFSKKKLKKFENQGAPSEKWRNPKWPPQCVKIDIFNLFGTFLSIFPWWKHVILCFWCQRIHFWRIY